MAPQRASSLAIFLDSRVHQLGSSYSTRVRDAPRPLDLRQRKRKNCTPNFGLRTSAALRRQHGHELAIRVEAAAPRVHSDELLRGSRVYGHRVVEIRFGRAHLHGDTKTLQHFVSRDADDVQPDNHLLSTCAHQLHGHGLLGSLVTERVVHRLKDGLIHLDVLVSIMLARSGLRQADGANWRVGEDHGGNVCVLELRLRCAPKEPIGKPPASSDGDGREFVAASRAVAQAVEALHPRVLLRIHHDAPLAVELHACGLEPHPRSDRRAADSHEDHVQLCQALACRELRRKLPILLLGDGDHLRLRLESDAGAGDFLIENLLDERIEAVAHHALAAASERDRRAQRIEDASELYSNIARADDKRLFRLRR
mmetsp:Transcript_38336/g.89724  ORF Transcript_38336/g.89724 Transcript_38336/m.89724 type:complete len:368 (-) Transcript_38336:647-1750(-)